MKKKHHHTAICVLYKSQYIGKGMVNIMINNLLNNIVERKELRQSLIQLKEELKSASTKAAILNQLGPDFIIFDNLLKDEDAKVRKNTALIMGELAVPSFLDKLFEAYNGEGQLFVKSAYLTAIGKFDYGKLLPDLKERLSALEVIETDDSNKKHINEEMRALSELILAKEGAKQHPFIGYDVPSELILLTNRNFSNLTLMQVNSKKAKEFNAGIILKTDNLREVLPIRTYGELLFVLEDIKVCTNDVTVAADAIAKSSLLDFMKKRHKGEAPYYFRIELKSKMELDKKSLFTKKLGTQIERLSKRNLINTTSNYEFEIRLIENKEGNYNVLIKLYTLRDERFIYRKNSIAASIQPVNAALIVALAKDYLKEGAQVLDPFCGVGTMLIERNFLVKANTMYGLDIYESAINKAIENTKAAKTIIHYINRNFFDFKHDYLFDEIITNMPRVLGHKEKDEIYELYQRFFLKAPKVLRNGAILIIFSHDRDYVRKVLNRNVYKIEQEYEISKKEGAYLFIIRYL